MKSALYSGIACVLGLLVSCSDSDTGNASSSTDSTKIGSRGGTVIQGDASVEVPAGALATATKIAVAPSNVDVAPPEGYVLAGPPIAFTPHGLSFEKAVTLTLPYDSSSDALAVLRLDDEADTSWGVVEGGEFAAGLATLDVRTFSIYAVAASVADGAGGAGGASSTAGAGGAVEAVGGALEAAGGADSTVGGAPSGPGDLSWSCDRSNTDGNGLRVCSEYFYPKMIADILGDKLTPGCPGPGNGVLGKVCDTTDAVAGCLTQDVDGVAGVTVTNWYYAGTKADIENGVLCGEDNSMVIDPP